MKVSEKDLRLMKQKPSVKQRYQWHKTWRYKHPEKRYEGKARYYRKHAIDKVCSGNRWTYDEINEIINVDRPADVSLSKMLGRTVMAIQVKRSTWLKKHGLAY